MLAKTLALAALAATFATGSAAAADLTAKFVDDSGWDGGAVPEGQWCSKYGGSGATPPIVVGNVPAEADAIVLAFNDETYKPMDQGGHGIVGFNVGDDSEVTVPSIPGETKDLPAGAFMVTKHRADAEGYSPGTAYLPPCSGGRGNTYTVTVQAVVLDDAGKPQKVLAETKLTLGTY